MATCLVLSLIAFALLETTPTTQAQAPATKAASPAKPRTNAQNVELVSHIGGATNVVFVSGNRAFVGEGPRLTILDVSNPAAPTVLGKTDVWSSLVRGIYAAGNYAYVTLGTAGLRVVNVANPAAPAQVGSLTTDASGNALDVSDILVVGNYAYMLCSSGFHVVDVSNPAAPTAVGKYNTITGWEPKKGIAITGNYAYVAGAGGLEIANISNPTSPTGVTIVSGLTGYPRGVAIAGNYAYVASTAFSGAGGLSVLDIANPASPTILGKYVAEVARVAVAGNYAYTLGAAQSNDSKTTLTVVDVSNASAPAKVSSYDTGGSSVNLTVTGGYAYVTNGWGGLEIVNVSAAAKPHAQVRSGVYNSPPGDARSAGVTGNYAYVADMQAGMKVINVANPAAPAGVGIFDTPGKVQDVVVAGQYAYLADYGNALLVVNVSNPAVPQQAGTLPSLTRPKSVAVRENRAYVACYSGGLRIADVSNPNAPAEITNANTAIYKNSSLEDLAVTDRYAYVASSLGGNPMGLLIADISNPSTPTEAGGAYNAWYAYDVALTGQSASGAVISANTRVSNTSLYAVVAADNVGVRVVDVSNPAAPSEVSSFGKPWQGKDLVLSGSNAYVAQDERGLRVIDVSDPTRPAETGSFDQYASDVAIGGNYAYLASNNALRVLDVSNPARPRQVGIYTSTLFVREVRVSGNYAYLSLQNQSDGTGALQVVDIGNPAAPNPVGLANLGQFGMGLAVSGNKAYVGSGGSVKLRVVDVSIPTAPIQVGSYSSTSYAQVNDIAVSGNYAYVGMDIAGMLVLNISNPAQPTKVGQYKPDGYNWVLDIAIVGNYAYLAIRYNTSASMDVVDISNPASPRRIGSYKTPSAPNGVAMSGSHVFMVDSTIGLTAVNVSNPAAPTYAGLFVPPGNAKHVATAGTLAYTIDNSGSFRVVDVSDPNGPRQVGYYPLAYVGDELGDITVVCGYIYVANGPAGLYILRYTGAGVTYCVSGRTMDVGGAPVAGVQVSAGTAGTASSDANGMYTLELSAGTHTVVPSLQGYFWSPESRTIAVPSVVTGVDFTGVHIRKQVTVSGSNPVNYGDVLNYTVAVVYPSGTTRLLYDAVPTYTTYIAGSLSAPAGITYDAATNALSGTLTLTASTPATVTFSARVAVTGTVGFAPIIVNRACVRQQGSGMDACEWSNEVQNLTYALLMYLPFISR